ncbi:GNAT family N-acetyltransferase [Desulfonatronum lacustre]|uniref:GNAT family N-acetyltransferase n=1 Tax=Desulfonatronum lacustre TaxID=66849 RepID=UPI0005578174|nr:GNAT family N-acetyltransferase [Desulfonatronum lacustre]
MTQLSPPSPVSPLYSLEDFDCGVAVLNSWLIKQALRNEASGASRTFIVGKEKKVAGYYALAVGSVERVRASAKIRRNMPEPVPVMVLGRLAVDLQWQGLGVGQGLLKDALLRTVAVSRQAGIRALVVHAISQEARLFYIRHGFLESPLDEMTLMLGLEKLLT